MSDKQTCCVSSCKWFLWRRTWSWRQVIVIKPIEIKCGKFSVANYVTSKSKIYLVTVTLRKIAHLHLRNILKKKKKIDESWQHCQMRYFDWVLSDVSWIRWLFNLIVSKYGCARFLKVLDTSFTKRTRRQIIVNLMRMKEIDSVHLMTWKLTEFWNEA